MEATNTVESVKVEESGVNVKLVEAYTTGHASGYTAEHKRLATDADAAAKFGISDGKAEARTAHKSALRTAFRARKQ